MKHLYDDWDAVVGRAKGLWAPRWRTASHGVATAALTGASSAAGTAAAAATDVEKKAVLMKGKGAEGDDGSASEDDGVTVTAMDAPNEWGGRGSPRAGDGDGDGGGGGSGGGVVVSASDEGVGRGAGGEGGGVGKGKGRWARAGWSTVDVRTVQSRLSRIVDDTSARIRSNIVVKVCAGRGVTLD